MLSGCNQQENSSKDDASSEEKKIEKIETLLTDFEDATTYEDKLKIFERLEDRYGDVDFEDSDNEDIYDDVYSEMSDMLSAYDEIVNSLENVLTSIENDYYGVEELFTTSELLAGYQNDEVAQNIIESFFEDNYTFLEESFTQYAYYDLNVSAYTLGYEYFKSFYEDSNFMYLFDDLFESENYASILESVNAKAKVNFEQYLTAGDFLKAQLDPLKTYEYTEIDEDGAYSAYLFGYANGLYAVFYDDAYFASEYLFEFGIGGLSPVTSDQVQDISFFVNGIEYPTDGIFSYDVYSPEYFEVYTKFSTDGNNSISLELFRAFVENTGDIIIRATLTDGTTEDIVVDTSLYSGEDIEMIKNLFTAMEAVHLLNVNN